MSTQNQRLVLANSHIHVELCERTGRLISINHLPWQLHLVREPKLAENVRLLVPHPDHRGFTISLANHPLAGIECSDLAARLTWRDLPGLHGPLAIEVTLIVELLDDGIRFGVEVVNDSTLLVEEVYCPAIGGINAPDGDGDAWRIMMPGDNGGGRSWQLFREVRNVYLGPADPTFVHAPKCMPWLDLYHESDRRGIYVAHEDPDSAFGAWWFQVTPGADWGGNGYVWPRTDQPHGLCLAWVCFPFCEPGHHWRSASTVIRFHEGIWWKATNLNRQFYDQHFSIDRSNNWLWREDAWQSTIISYPDDEIGYRFADLPGLADQAMRAGINVIQIDGWDRGGLDRDYPHYEPDPRLGTAEELRRAITECEEMGVRVLLFANLHQVHVETEWYERELHRYTRRNIHGHCMDNMGWEYNTAGGLIGHRKPRMVDCNPAHPAFAKIMDQNYDTIAELGAAGCQVDKVTTGPNIDFNPDLPRALPKDHNWSAPALAAFKRHQDIGRRHRADYALAAETHFDRLFPIVEVAYARHWHHDQPQLCGATFPEFKQTCCITGPTDYRLVNHCLRLGLVINIEARCLHSACDSVPQLIDHMKKVRALRRACWDQLWLGRLLDPHECLIDADPRLLVSRFRGAGRDALVLCHWEEQIVSGSARLGGYSHAELWRTTAGQAKTVQLPVEINVAPDEAIVIRGL